LQPNNNPKDECQIKKDIKNYFFGGNEIAFG
jgi:hypothetical protein